MYVCMHAFTHVTAYFMTSVERYTITTNTTNKTIKSVCSYSSYKFTVEPHFKQIHLKFNRWEKQTITTSK